MKSSETKDNDSPRKRSTLMSTPKSDSTAPAEKPEIVFVGAFSSAPDGAHGGVTFTCQMIVRSPLSDLVHWRLIDSTFKSFPIPGLFRRSLFALGRTVQVIRSLFSRKVRTLLVFTTFTGGSLVEKGLQCMLGRLFGKRVVLCIQYGPYLSNRFTKLMRWYARRTIRCCDVIICQSPVAADRLRNLFGCEEHRICVITNWLDADRYAPTQPQLAAREQRAAEPAILFLGLLEQRKGCHLLLEAAGRLAQRGRTFRLVIGGSGPEDQPLRQQAHHLGLDDRVEFLGWVSRQDAAEVFQSGDIFVLATYSEGLPNALLEAMACGLPVVTTPVDGIPSVVDDGENGFLIPPGDVDALTEALDKLLADPELARQMGQTNRRRILANHHIGNIWPRIAQTLGVEVPVDVSADVEQDVACGAGASRHP